MRLLVFLVGCFVNNPVAYAIAERLTRLAATIRPAASESIDWYRKFYNLTGPDADARRFYTTGRVYKFFYYIDLFTFAAASESTLRRRMDVVGVEHFDRVKGSGRPILFLQMHSGSFYMLLVWLASGWKRINAVFVNQSRLRQAIHDAALNPYLDHRLQSYHEIVAGLRRGESCLVMFDGGKFRPKNAEHLVVNGCDLYFPTSSLAMARETGCHILPVYSTRTKWNRTIFHFGEPVDCERTRSMAEIFEWYHHHLNRDPAQWYALVENLTAGERIRSQSTANAQGN